MDKKIRWDSYVLMKGFENIQAFWKQRFTQIDHKLLFIMGKGFDIRMNMGIEAITNNPSVEKTTCILIDFEEGVGSSSIEYRELVDENFSNLTKIKNIDIVIKKINLWKGKGRNKRRIGDREASDLISSYSDIQEYTDIVVDISALPRGIYFSLIGKILTLIDINIDNKRELHNLFVVVSENASIDQITTEDEPDDDLKYTLGFGGGLELTSEHPVVWFPILGEDKRRQIEKANSKINPHEICPLLPFPAKNIRRSDALIIEYHQLLFDELRIEPQNLLYVPEQNPFEVYRNLYNAISNYNKTLNIINGCKAAISTFSSKLLSLGALLTAYELNSLDEESKIGVGILNVDTNGYKIQKIEDLASMNEETELFLLWLTGEPYNN